MRTRTGKTLPLVRGLWLTCLAPYTVLHAAECQPTPPDALGPFSKPEAPMRTRVGEGYVLQGVVRSTATCQPLPGVMVELWMAGPDGRYDGADRARLIAGAEGQYQFKSHVPVSYFGRPPHIHIRVSAAGHRVSPSLSPAVPRLSPPGRP